MPLFLTKVLIGIVRIDIDNSHELATELWEGADFYVAIIANNTDGTWHESEVSVSWYWQLSSSINGKSS